VAVPLIAPTAQELADAAAAAASSAASTVKGGAGGSVMVPGPKVPVGVGNYPEYDEIKAKNGGKPLISKDYKEILNQLAGEYPNFFAETGNKKITTYINSLNKTELIAFAEKVLKQKYEFIEQEQHSSATLIQNVLRGHKGRGEVKQIKYETKYQALGGASASMIQLNFRNRNLNKSARQEFERQRLLGVPFLAQPDLYPHFRGMGSPLGDINVFDPSGPFDQAAFDAFFGL
jgi:hypothetical protein